MVIAFSPILKTPGRFKLQFRKITHGKLNVMHQNLSSFREYSACYLMEIAVMVFKLRENEIKHGIYH